jgi:O-succinylbenzoic acid--CoA ligase
VPDLVAIDMPGGQGFVDALRRAWDGGAAVLPVDQRLAPPAKASLLARLRPTVVAWADGRSRLNDGQPVEDGDALVVATSGTTGEPKGVVLTHAAVEASARATSARLRVDPGSHRWLACLPLSHVGGLAVVTRSLLTGCPLTVLPGFDAQVVAAESGPDVFVSLVHTALRRTGAELFHTVVLGGSAPPPRMPANVVTTYGMTETGSGVVYDGLPLDGVEVAIDGSTSEILLRGPMLLRAYRDGEVPLDSGGWLATGDSGRIRTDGSLEVDGRIAEMIVTGGENVWPVPVEVALREHPGVRDVAIGGVPDPDWGQEVVAWVVPADPGSPPSLGELRSVVAQRLAPFAAPRRVVLVESLPRSAIGKVRKDLLTVPGTGSVPTRHAPSTPDIRPVTGGGPTGESHP